MEISSPIVINTSWTQPVSNNGDVFLAPPGSIRVSGDAETLYAVRVGVSGQTVGLNGAVSSKGTGTWTYGILFRGSSGDERDGRVQFYAGNAKIDVTGGDIATGISGADLLITGKNAAPLSGSLNVSAKSDGYSPMASGLYAQNIEITSVLAMRISVKTETENETGVATTYGIFAGNSIFNGFSNEFRLTAKAGSAMNADAFAISGDIDNHGALAGKITVEAAGLFGDGANAYGFYGNVATQSVGGNFRLSLESRSETGVANACGFMGDFTSEGSLNGAVIAKARTTSGLYSMAVGFGSVSDVAGVSDNFRLNASAKGGWSQAIATGITSGFTTDGTLSGTFKISADGCNDESEYVPYGTEAYGFNGAVSAGTVSNKFNLDVRAKAGYSGAKAYGFASTLNVGNENTLGGTVFVKAEATGEAAADAVGVADVLTAAAVGSGFKLTVNATTQAGTATARGFAATDIATGLAGNISVTAKSKSGSAEAVGGLLSPTLVFRTRAGSKFNVTAKTGSDTATAAAYGLNGATGVIDLAGRLTAVGQGGVSSAYGVDAAGALWGSVSGVVSVVGKDACGIRGGDASSLVVSGGVYAGTGGNANEIARYLENRIGTGRSAANRTKYADQAITLGNDSALTLTDGSIVIGDVTPGGGNSTLNLSTGAQLYGDLGMASGSDLFISVNGSSRTAAMVTLKSAGAGIFTEASGVNLSITATDVTQTGSYVLLAGSDLSELKNADFNTLFDLVDFNARGFDVAWNLDLSGKTDKLTMTLTEAPIELVRIMDFPSANPLMAASSLTDEIAKSGANAFKNAFIA